jgi:diguanylate cyclase (GGDEF)-like protein
MVCDLNGFKAINDRFGHVAGDKALKLFASLLQDVCREYDYAARMGGDEFVILAPNMTPASVAEKAILLSTLAQEAGRAVCGRNILSLSLELPSIRKMAWKRSRCWPRPIERCMWPRNFTTSRSTCPIELWQGELLLTH